MRSGAFVVSDFAVLGSAPRTNRVAAEAIVEAEQREMRGLVDVERRGGAGGRGERRRLAAEVHVVVLDLRRPVRRERVLPARADRPAAAGAVAGVEQHAGRGGRSVRLIDPGAAALYVEQAAVERIADAAGDVGEPIGVGVQADAGKRRVIAIGIRPVEHAFNAEHPRAGLIVATDLAAGGRARSGVASGASAGRRAPVVVQPETADVAADVTTGPREGYGRGGRLVDRTARRQIGR